MRFPIRAAAAAFVFAAVAAVPAAAHAQAPKLAFVDVAILMEQAPGRADAQKQFEGEAGAIRAELQRMSDSLDAMVSAYQKEQATMTPAAKTAREKVLQTRQGEYQQRAQALQARGQQREQELSGQFEGLVRDAINDVRTSDGYAMVFASGANSAMLSGDKSLDITDKVLARMRTIASTRPTASAPSRPAAQQAAPAPTTGAPVAAPAGAARPKSPGGER
ncbi:MAG: OmpH family outer membrane protein [Gemmatirosa sp.]|nr:OmpH family outer membrane protein [Gemmatirosa sp.]